MVCKQVLIVWWPLPKPFSLCYVNTYFLATHMMSPNIISDADAGSRPTGTISDVGRFWIMYTVLCTQVVEHTIEIELLQ